MIKVVIFCCKLCFFLILAPFDDWRVQEGVGKILTLLLPALPLPPLPPPQKKGMLDHSLCASTTKQLIDS